MPRPSFVAAVTIVLLSVAPTLDATDATAAPSDVERYAIGDAATLLVSRVADAPTVAICVGEARVTGRSAPDPLELARRGGTEQDVLGPDVSTWCAALPPAELAYGLFLAAHLRASDEAAATADGEPDPVVQARTLALEGEAAREPSPARRVVCVSGPFRLEDVVRLATHHLGELSAAPAIRPLKWSLHQTSERLSVLDGTLDIPVVRYGWAVPDAGPDRDAALDVAFEILAGRNEARLPRLLVPRGLARRATRLSVRGAGGSMLGLTVELTTRGSIDRVRRFVDGSLKQLRLVGPSAREVAQATASLRRHALETRENLDERTRALTELEATLGDATRLDDDLDALAGVTPERIRAAAHELLIDAHRTTLESYPKQWPTDDPALSRHRLYTVAEGDTLAAVAARFHVDAARLAKDNDVDPRYSLVAGQPLWIPP